MTMFLQLKYINMVTDSNGDNYNYKTVFKIMMQMIIFMLMKVIVTMSKCW